MEISDLLFASCIAGQIESIESLLDKGADIHAGDDLALQYAAKNVKEYFEQRELMVMINSLM